MIWCDIEPLWLVKQALGVSLSFIWQLKLWQIIVGGCGLCKQSTSGKLHIKDKAVMDVSLLLDRWLNIVGRAWAICNWSSEMPSLLRVITNHYMSSNRKTIVRACIKGVNTWRWMSWRCLKFSCHLCLANLDSHCSSISLSLLTLYCSLRHLSLSSLFICTWQCNEQYLE